MFPLHNLPPDLQSLILEFVGTRILMANRIRTAFRVFKRRVGWFTVYVPSRKALALHDPGRRVVRVITLAR